MPPTFLGPIGAIAPFEIESFWFETILVISISEISPKPLQLEQAP